MKTVIPEDIKSLDDNQIAELEAELLAEFDDAIDGGANDVALLTEIADAVDNVRGEQAARKIAAEEAAQAVAALADRIRPSDTEPVAVGDEDDADEDVAETTEATDDVVVEAETEERELVTASADKQIKAPSARAASRRTVAPEVTKPAPEVVITAAADVPGYSGGATLDTVELAKAFHHKARTLSNGSGMVPVATINLPIEHKLGADMAYNLDVIETVTNPASLTAAGWCAPSNNWYEMFGIDAGDGLIDLPTVQITRGGLNVPSFLGITDAANALWTWTEEDQDDAEATKPCLYIPCPDFTDYRLEAEGLCLTNGNLTDRAFPELTARFVALTVNAHLHRLSAAIIAKIVGTATGVTMAALPSSAAGSVLHAIDLQVADYRSQYRMSVNSVLEAVFPLWVKELLRADLAMRTGVDLVNVTDARLDEYFATRKVRAQFVHDYQPLYSVSPKTAFPTSMDFLLYPAGGYVRGDGGTIDLGVVRDSVLNATNDYTAAWTEQMYLVAQVGPDAREVTVNFAVDGVTGCCEVTPPAEV